MRTTTALSFHILSAKEMVKSGIGPLLVRGSQLALRGARSLMGAGKAIPNIGKIPPTVPKVINKFGGPATAIAAGGLGAGSVGALNSGSDQSMGPAFNGGVGQPRAFTPTRLGDMPGAKPGDLPGGPSAAPRLGDMPGAKYSGPQPPPYTGIARKLPSGGGTVGNYQMMGGMQPLGLGNPPTAGNGMRPLGLGNPPTAGNGMRPLGLGNPPTAAIPGISPKADYGGGVGELDNLQGAHLPGNMGDAVVPESAPQAPAPMQGPVDERSLQGLDDSTNPENLATSQQMQKPESAIVAPAPMPGPMDPSVLGGQDDNASDETSNGQSAIAAPAPLNSDSYLPPAPPAQMPMASERPADSAIWNAGAAPANGLSLATPPPMDISAPQPAAPAPAARPQQPTAPAQPPTSGAFTPTAEQIKRFNTATQSTFGGTGNPGDMDSMRNMILKGGANPNARTDSMNTFTPSEYRARQRRAQMGGGMQVKKNSAATSVADLIRKYLGE